MGPLPCPLLNPILTPLSHPQQSNLLQHLHPQQLPTIPAIPPTPTPPTPTAPPSPSRSLLHPSDRNTHSRKLPAKSVSFLSHRHQSSLIGVGSYIFPAQSSAMISPIITITCALSSNRQHHPFPTTFLLSPSHSHLYRLPHKSPRFPNAHNIPSPCYHPKFNPASI